MGKMTALFVWIIAIIVAILSGFLFKTDNLAIFFCGFLLFCFSATLAGYQINRSATEKRTSSHSTMSSLPKGAMGMGALLMSIPAFIGYLIP